ncbi:hypothetical protein [Kitasatospora sp. NPDC088351]|uniref:hypothetical protein n=1 Tax=unclassified Kitasatospora TaxID=2633591 RepID=UPI00341C34C5
MPVRRLLPAVVRPIAATGLAVALAVGGTVAARSAPVAASAGTPAAASANLARTGADRSLGILASVGSAVLLTGATIAVIHRQRRGRDARAR